MPKQSENDNNGTYELFGFVYQPQLRVERPNGYRSPVPSPNNGQTPGLWNNILAPPIWGASKAKSSWGPMTPTAAPAPSASNQTQVTRG
jgi:hypothetical protein